MTNRIWLASANPARCNHRMALESIHLVSWRMDRRKFEVGDIVFLYFKDTQRVEYKTIVTEVNVGRKDHAFWKEKAPETPCATLERVTCIIDERLTWTSLSEYGFHPQSLEGPTCKNEELLQHINEIFG